MNARVAAVSVLVIAGLGLVALPALLSHSVPWPEIIQHTGLAVVVAGGVALLEPLLAKWVRESRSLEERRGLVDIRERKEFDKHVAGRLVAADTIKIVATCLDALLAPLRYELIDALERRRRGDGGQPIQIVVLSPETPALLERLVLDDLTTVDADTTPTIRRWREAIRELQGISAKYPKELQLQMTPLSASASIFIIDDDLYVTPYIYGRRGSRALCYRYRKVEGAEVSVYRIYDEAFERYWAFVGSLQASGWAEQRETLPEKGIAI